MIYKRDLCLDGRRPDRILLLKSLFQKQLSRVLWCMSDQVHVTYFNYYIYRGSITTMRDACNPKHEFNRARGNQALQQINYTIL